MSSGFSRKPVFAAAHQPWEQVRAPADDSASVLQERTFKWLATLPAELRPMETARRYARIVNRIAGLWPHCEYTRLHFQALLVDRRTGRQGFPAEIRRELVALQRHYHENLSGLPAILWDAVPVKAPKIPDQVFAPRPTTGQIRIRGLPR